MIHTLIHQFGVFAWKKKQREREREGEQQETNEERRKDKRNRGRRGGKAIRGRDCEPRRETYGLFLVSSCVSHSENSVEKAHW